MMKPCANPNCAKIAQTRCAAPGYCRWSCAVEHGAVADDDDQTCALEGCCHQVTKKKQHWTPCCCYTSKVTFEAMLDEAKEIREDRIRCGICYWTHFSDFDNCYDNKGYPCAGQWMVWHIECWHEEVFEQSICQLHHAHCIESV